MQWRFKFATMLVLVAALAGGLTPPEAAAGPNSQQTIRFTLQGSFTGATGGGGSSATAVLSGTTDPGLTNLSRLSGSVNLGGVRDYNFQVNPTGLVTTNTNTFPGNTWMNCNFFPFPPCDGILHVFTVVQTFSSVPVDLHFGGSHGTANLNWNRSICTGDCPPGFPQGFSSANLSGGVNGAQTAGQLNLSGSVTVQENGAPSPTATLVQPGTATPGGFGTSTPTSTPTPGGFGTATPTNTPTPAGFVTATSTQS